MSVRCRAYFRAAVQMRNDSPRNDRPNIRNSAKGAIKVDLKRQQFVHISFFSLFSQCCGNITQQICECLLKVLRRGCLCSTLGRFGGRDERDVERRRRKGKDISVCFLCETHLRAFFSAPSSFDNECESLPGEYGDGGTSDPSLERAANFVGVDIPVCLVCVSRYKI